MLALLACEVKRKAWHYAKIHAVPAHVPGEEGGIWCLLITCVCFWCKVVYVGRCCTGLGRVAVFMVSEGVFMIVNNCSILFMVSGISSPLSRAGHQS